MPNYLKKLTADPKLDFTCTYSVSESIYKILEHEKIANNFKVFVAFGGLVLTIIISLIAVYGFHKEIGTPVIGTAFSGLLTAMAVEDATDSKKNLLEALQSKINDLPEEDLRKKYLDMLFKIVETQSFPK